MSGRQVITRRRGRADSPEVPRTSIPREGLRRSTRSGCSIPETHVGLSAGPAEAQLDRVLRIHQRPGAPSVPSRPPTVRARRAGGARGVSAPPRGPATRGSPAGWRRGRTPEPATQRARVDSEHHGPCCPSRRFTRSGDLEGGGRYVASLLPERPPRCGRRAGRPRATPRPRPGRPVPPGAAGPDPTHPRSSQTPSTSAHSSDSWATSTGSGTGTAPASPTSTCSGKRNGCFFSAST